MTNLVWCLVGFIAGVAVPTTVTLLVRFDRKLQDEIERGEA